MSYYKPVKDVLARGGPATAAQIARALGLKQGNTISPILSQLEARGEVVQASRIKKIVVWELRS